MTTTIEHLRDGDGRYRVVERETDAEGIARDRTLGFVRRWHDRDGRVNETGRALFRASILGRFETADFETIAAAVSFVVSTSTGAA